MNFKTNKPALMKPNILIVILLIIVSLHSCIPTKIFFAKKCTNLVAIKPSTKVKIKELNKYDKNGNRKGWHVIFNADTSIIAKFKDGEINGRVFVIDSTFQVIQKYKMRDSLVRGIVVSYYSNEYKWSEVLYYDKNGDKTYLRKRR